MIYTIGDVYGFTLCDSLVKLSEIERSTSAKNWNGNDVGPISKQVIDNTRDILLRLINQPFIAPTSKGYIQLKYNNDDGAYLEFEVFDDKVKMFFYHGVAYIRELKNLNNLNWMVINFLYGNYSPVINEEK